MEIPRELQEQPSGLQQLHPQVLKAQGPPSTGVAGGVGFRQLKADRNFPVSAKLLTVLNHQHGHAALRGWNKLLVGRAR